MIRRIFMLAALLLLGASGDAAQPAGLPAPPPSFTWKRLEAIKGAFLMPDGWHYKEESRPGTLAFFITQENIDRAGRFETGLSLNVVRNIQTNAQEYAKAYIARVARQNQLLNAWEVGSGLVKGWACQLRTLPRPGVAALRMRVLALANARTNTVYLLMFESPDAKWDAAWVTGSHMLDTFALDDEI